MCREAPNTIIEVRRIRRPQLYRCWLPLNPSSLNIMGCPSPEHPMGGSTNELSVGTPSTTEKVVKRIAAPLQQIEQATPFFIHFMGSHCVTTRPSSSNTSFWICSCTRALALGSWPLAWKTARSTNSGPIIPSLRLEDMGELTSVARAHIHVLATEMRWCLVPDSRYKIWSSSNSIPPGYMVPVVSYRKVRWVLLLLCSI